MLAPGVGISAAGETMSGTSQATPFVSAALAVMRGRYPGYTVQQTIAALTSTGKLVSTHCYAVVALLVDRAAVATAEKRLNSGPAFAQSSLTCVGLNMARGGIFCLPVRPPLSVAGSVAYTICWLTPVLAAAAAHMLQILDSRNGLQKPRLNLRAAASISCTPKISPSSVLAPSEGGTFTLTVTPPTSDCTWTVAPPTSTWMRIVGPNTGIGPGTVILQIDPVEVAARGVGVAVSAEDGSNGLSLLVSQASVPAGVDTRAPITAGRIKVQSLQGAVALTWPPARDSQSGVSSYMVVYNTGSRPPRPRCTTGTQVNLQPQAAPGNILKLTVPGLLPNTRYSFRVCPIDAAGNVGTGSMWRGTPARRR